MQIKTHRKGLMQKVKKVREETGWQTFHKENPAFLKSGQILTFRRRVPETKKHIIYFISIYGNFIFLEHDLKN